MKLLHFLFLLFNYAKRASYLFSFFFSFLSNLNGEVIFFFSLLFYFYLASMTALGAAADLADLGLAAAC
jgi:hypothetical protein